MVQGARVTYTRRIFGDSLLEGVLFGLTLGIGWLIWFAIVASKGQTPAKQLLNVRILDNTTGQLASTGQVWKREFVGKVLIQIALSVVGLILLGQNGGNLANVYTLIGGIMILANSDDRAIWDYIGDTKLGYFPNGLDVPVEGGFPTVSGQTSPSQRLMELESLLQAGTISQSEYESKRADILKSL